MPIWGFPVGSLYCLQTYDIPDVSCAKQTQGQARRKVSERLIIRLLKILIVIMVLLLIIKQTSNNNSKKKAMSQLVCSATLQ